MVNDDFNASVELEYVPMTLKTRFGLADAA